MTESMAASARILVIDDEPAFRSVLARMLERLGFDVLLAADGTQGLELARREHVHLIILDQRMPGITGVEVARQLRASGSEAPLVLVSGAGDVEELASRERIALWASKPILRSDLIDLLRRAGLPVNPRLA